MVCVTRGSVYKGERGMAAGHQSRKPRDPIFKLKHRAEKVNWK